MIVYANGCSHTHGYACVSPQQTWPNLVIRTLDNDCNYLFFNKEYKAKLNIVKKFIIGESILINEAQNGAGNDYIFHHTIETVTKFIKINKKPDLVILQWSGTNRRMHTTINGDEEYVNATDSPELGIKYEPMGSQHTCHYVYMLQEFFKKNDIKYLFFNYMAWDSSVINTEVFTKIDFENWVDFGMGKQIIFEGLISLFKEKKFTCDELGHPNLEGSYFIAEQILKKLGKQILPLDKFYKKLM